MRHCKFCHGSKKMRQLIGFNGKEQIYRWIRCVCDTEVRRRNAAKTAARKLIDPERVLPAPSAQPETAQTVLMHNEEGEKIRVERHEVAEWQAEGFQRYRQPPRVRKLSKKARQAAAKRQGKCVSRKPTARWLAEKAKEALER